MIPILNIDLSELLFRVKLTSFILSLFFIFTAVYFMVNFQKLIGLKRKMMLSSLNVIKPPSTGGSQSRWEEITRHLESVRESEWKFAVIEADNLVDEFLKSAGYLGEGMGERLTSIEKGQFESLEGLWEAHKIRNKLVHDSNYFLRHAEARRAIELYSKTLKELGVV